ncbi:cytochrome P450 [Ruegeria sp. HKCCC1038]|uniref:cytochrome P450 n=1 Tax=Ruegeria sp. HKCCC1038 TaxID=2682982 RepID=UPI0014895E97|nr:cytochrome P450 [Ruegeria sp. HKCCC1038]
MKTIQQSPTETDFVQNPYPFYDRARQLGDLVYWTDYNMPAAVSHNAVQEVFRDRRFGTEKPKELEQPQPDHLTPWLNVEAHSLLEAEPPHHTRLRSLVLRAFTSRAIAGLSDDLETLCHRLIDQFPDAPFDLLSAYCTQIPVITICRLLGVPEDRAPDLLRWSHAMVAMYQAGRTEETEHAAARATQDFTAFLTGYIETRRSQPRDDLITSLIAAEDKGEKLSHGELISTCILLLNAGHEATVHSLGNGVKTLLETGIGPEALTHDAIDATIEEILRYDPPLHLFTRYAYEEIDLYGHRFQRGDQIALLLGAANRDPAHWPAPNRFDPSRAITTNSSFGGGIHFCVGAPLARLEMRIALPILFQRCPKLRLHGQPRYALTYHFHGLTELMVET